ncbi:hypothetical protein F3Y22_tig00004779pilonHSYRG00226 [Hibiscus syriacus]|uniref:Uncharacterized protein n=1 Tax=Hibiscus syriacus TaxID=106335 RepID=A0A6A3CKU1_HIBSY|nr:hypothetical protein F3Y22_tig00004779pilonHSYRG00226 [Hibiscus syriacus]
MSQHGVFLCGPVRNAFLSAWKRSNYQYVHGNKPAFLSDRLSKIEKGVVDCFLVLAVRWRINASRGFEMLTGVDADSLGPVSLPGSDELEW